MGKLGSIVAPAEARADNGEETVGGWAGAREKPLCCCIPAGGLFTEVQVCSMVTCSRCAVSKLGADLMLVLMVTVTFERDAACAGLVARVHQVDDRHSKRVLKIKRASHNNRDDVD